MSEQGEGFSLQPWGRNTPYYQGYDDGGKEYLLPAGFEVAETQFGEKAIYHGNDYCELRIHPPSGKPQLAFIDSTNMPVLKMK